MQICIQPTDCGSVLVVKFGNQICIQPTKRGSVLAVKFLEKSKITQLALKEFGVVKEAYNTLCFCFVPLLGGHITETIFFQHYM